MKSNKHTDFFRSIALLIILCFLLQHQTATAQINKETLSLKVANAEAANLEKLKAFIWKRKSDVFVSNELKATVITECKFDSSGKLDIKPVDASSTVKEKSGIRGKMQKNAAEDKMEYIGKALELSLAYTYMSKGQLVDFFSKASITAGEGSKLIIVAENLYVKGDKLTVHIDTATTLFTYKEFSSLLGKDPIDGKMNYETFKSGISHVNNTIMNLPAQKTKIEAKNQDYAQRVQ